VGQLVFLIVPLLRGALSVTVADTCYVTCPKTGLKAILQYLEEGWIPPRWAFGWVNWYSSLSLFSIFTKIPRLCCPGLTRIPPPPSFSILHRLPRTRRLGAWIRPDQRQIHRHQTVTESAPRSIPPRWAFGWVNWYSSLSLFSIFTKTTSTAPNEASRRVDSTRSAPNSPAPASV
jgi:hypothetical protein